MCEALERARIDFVDLSGGTFEGRAFDHKKESTVSSGLPNSRNVRLTIIRKSARLTSSSSLR